MLPSRRPAARDSLGVWYFEAWRYYCQWFLQEDENMQTWLRYEWSAREKRYQQAGQRSTDVIAFRMQLGLEMKLIFYEEDRKFQLNKFLAIQSDLKELARATKEKLEDKEKQRRTERFESLASWHLMDPTGYDGWQDTQAGLLWQQQLQEAKDKEEHRRHEWLAKKRNAEVVAEEAIESQFNKAREAIQTKTREAIESREGQRGEGQEGQG